jgi:hypothetical protein
MPQSLSTPSKRRLTAEQKAAIRAAVAEGLSCGEAARKAGCSLSAAKSLVFREKRASPRMAQWEVQRELARDGKRLCPRRKEVLPLAEFRLSDGRAKYSYCLACCRRNEQERCAVPRLRFQRMAIAARQRAIAKGIPFEPTVRSCWG